WRVGGAVVRKRPPSKPVVCVAGIGTVPPATGETRSAWIIAGSRMSGIGHADATAQADGPPAHPFGNLRAGHRPADVIALRDIAPQSTQDVHHLERLDALGHHLPVQ